MRSAAIILTAAATAGGVILTFSDSRQALGDDIKLEMPKEAFGFVGTLSAQVVKAPDKVYGWFQVKVVKVIGLARNNQTRLKAAALTAVWKDKYVAVRGVPNMPELRAGDMVTIVAAQFEMHLRATKVTKQEGARPNGPAGAASSPAASSTRKPVAGGRIYDLAFSTFFGAKMDCRGMTVDAEGNAYLAGSTWDADCPTTEGAYDRTFHGEADMAISKWSPEGKLLWSTLVGSPGHDRPYSVKVDSKGCVYAAGIGGVGLPVSPDAFQPNPLARTKNVKIPGEEYVGANGYIVKLSADGAKVLWGSYVGSNIECRDLAIDDEDNLYLTFGWLKDSAGELPASWFANAYRKRPRAGRTLPGRVEDLGVMKVSGDGKTVFWATYIGGSGGNALEASLCVGPDHCPIVFTGTSSHDMPTTPGVMSDKPKSSWLGKFSADGSRLLFGTYLGAGQMSVPRTHDVALDSSGNIFATCCVQDGWPTTPGAFQRKYGGGNTDFGVVKLSPTGKLLACTYLGGSGDEINGPDTLSVGKDGSVLITSGWGTTSPDYPVTAGCFQPRLHGKNNAVFSLLSNDLGTLLYSTYMGGQGANLRANAFAPDGSIWVAGHSPGPEWPLKTPIRTCARRVSCLPSSRPKAKRGQSKGARPVDGRGSLVGSSPLFPPPFMRRLWPAAAGRARESIALVLFQPWWNGQFFDALLQCLQIELLSIGVLQQPVSGLAHLGDWQLMTAVHFAHRHVRTLLFEQFIGFARPLDGDGLVLGAVQDVDRLPGEVVHGKPQELGPEARHGGQRGEEFGTLAAETPRAVAAHRDPHQIDALGIDLPAPLHLVHRVQQILQFARVRHHVFRWLGNSTIVFLKAGTIWARATTLSAVPTLCWPPCRKTNSGKPRVPSVWSFGTEMWYQAASCV